MKVKNLNILSPRTSNPFLYIIYNFYIFYNNLVDRPTCNIALIVFLKCDVTKFISLPPLVTQCHTSSTPPPLNV